MNLQRIECFLMVAQHKSFSQAASDLFMAQSSVTGQIKKLEEEVGFQVLERGWDGVRLTPAGQCLWEEFKEIMERYTGAVNRCRQIAREDTSLLSIGYPNPPEWGNMPELIRRFRGQNPDVKLGLKLDKGKHLSEAFRTGALDILFGDMGYLEQLKGARVIHLFQAPFYVLIPPGHELESREKVTVEDVNRHRVFCLSPKTRDVSIGILSGHMKEAGVKLEQLVPMPHREDVVACVYAGMGLGIVPGTLAPDHYQARAAVLDAPQAYFSLGCACHNNGENKLRDKFIDLAMKHWWMRQETT